MHCVAGCRLFKWCLNLPAERCVAAVQAVKAVLEHSSRALWGRGAGCMFKWCWNLPPMHCGAGSQAV